MVTRTYYEDQMPLEEDVIQGGSVQSLTRNFLGGRGLEAITTTANNVTTTAYPLYDTHGNMVATLTKNASGTSWNVGNERSYDVWGGVRSGSATGGPKGRYCANLGHVQDDESGLIYMRARYYEPSTGRFISEDPVGDRQNWYVYAGNAPTLANDPDGFKAQAIWLGTVLTLVNGLAGLLAGGIVTFLLSKINPRYDPSGIMAMARDAAVAVLGGLMLTLASDVKAAKLGQLPLTELVKRIGSSMARTKGSKVVAGSIATGKVGALIGVYSALLSYFASPAYSEAWGDTWDAVLQ